MRCEEARRRLLTHAWDAQASRHLESCAACFAALEAADPLATAMRSARPEDAPAPDSIADAVMARLRPRRRPSRLPAALTAGIVAAVVLMAIAVELVVGVEPDRLAWLGNPTGNVLPALTPLLVIRAILLDEPVLLTALGATTAFACALWLRLALRPPTWRAAR
jgi:hypothetical protein